MWYPYLHTLTLLVNEVSAYGRGLGMKLMSTNANSVTENIVSHTLHCSFKLNNFGHALAPSGSSSRELIE